MVKPTKTNASYEDVLAAPADVRAELIDGDLYCQAAPKGIHQRVIKILGNILPDESTQPGWVILPGVEIHIPYTLTPDLTGWRIERFTEDIDSAYFTVTPDWVCEVLSKSTASYDRSLKRQKYLDARVAYLWLVEPRDRYIEVFANDAATWRLLGTIDESTRELPVMPFDRFPLQLYRLWS